MCHIEIAIAFNCFSIVFSYLKTEFQFHPKLHFSYCGLDISASAQGVGAFEYKVYGCTILNY